MSDTKQIPQPVIIVGLVLAAGVFGYTIWLNGQSPEGAAQEPSVTLSEPEVQPGPAVPNDQTGPKDDVANTVPDAPEVETPEATAEATPAPTFDVVRIDRDGSALIAGRAAPGQDVQVMIDGVEVSTVESVGTGSFVAMLDLAPSEAPRVVTLQTANTEGVATRSTDSVIVAPTPLVVEPDAGTSADAVVEAEPSTEPSVQTEAPAIESGPTDTQLTQSAASTAISATTDVSVVQNEPEIEDQELVATRSAPVETTATQAPAVLLASAEGVRVLQPANKVAGLPSSVRLDAISYGSDGAVVLTGRGSEASADARANVRIYLNNKAVETAPVNNDGAWATELTDVAEGVYTLRVDQLDDEGNVASRFETPFKREAKEVLEKALVVDDSDVAVSVSVVTVQPGFTLWGIAAEQYGDGGQYVKVFAANENLIKNPDLIYPGQVFDLPKN